VAAPLANAPIDDDDGALFADTLTHESLLPAEYDW
jgi:hypothetical protein